MVTALSAPPFQSAFPRFGMPSFTPIPGSLRTETNIIPVAVDNWGETKADIFATTEGTLSPGDKKIGTLSSDGRYVIQAPGVSNYAGNIFQDNRLTVLWQLFSLAPSQVVSSPFSQALEKQGRTIAEKNAMGPWIQSTITGKGAGTLIWILDKDERHIEWVGEVTQDAQYGIAKDAFVQPVFFKPHEFRLYFNPTSKVYVDKNIENYIYSSFMEQVGRIQHLLTEEILAPPYPDVMLIAEGSSRVDLYKWVQEKALPFFLKNMAENKSTEEVDPAFRELIMDWAESPQAIVDYIDNLLTDNPRIEEALQAHRKTMAQLKGMGISVVFPAGNEHEVMPDGVNLKPEAYLNYFAQSDDVITVAASNTNQTPSDLSDDSVSPFSSPGFVEGKTNKCWGPTIAAPGHLIPLGELSAPQSGTTFAMGFVGGLIALMKEKNPSLTPDQIKQILQQAAENTQHTEEKFVGQGYVNPIRAVELAESLVTK